MTLDIIVATIGANCFQECVNSWRHVDGVVSPYDGPDAIMQKYQRGFEQSNADLLAYFHDDLLITEQGWQQRVLKEFGDESVGLVGFGGAIGHGSPDLYRTPYALQQLGRQDYISNVEDAETHGRRLESTCDAAVLDGFCLIIRRNILTHIGGWPINTDIGYIAYDYWLSCMVRRLGYRIRMVGVRCLHLGGRSAVALKGDTGGEDHHARAHEYIYKEFADVLPFRAG